METGKNNGKRGMTPAELKAKVEADKAAKLNATTVATKPPATPPVASTVAPAANPAVAIPPAPVPAPVVVVDKAVRDARLTKYISLVTNASEAAATQQVAAMSDGEKESMVAELDKATASFEAAKGTHSFNSFKSKLEKEGVEYITKLAKDSGLDLKTLGGKVVRYTFPEGVPTLAVDDPANGKKGRGGGKKGGSGPTSHGKVMYNGVEYTSLHDFCVKNAIKYEGRPTAFKAAEDPRKADGTEYPYIFKSEVRDGKIVLTKADRPKV